MFLSYFLLTSLKSHFFHHLIHYLSFHLSWSTFSFTSLSLSNTVPVYQLGYSTVCLTGQILMSAGLPVKFYTLDDSVWILVDLHIISDFFEFYMSSLNKVCIHQVKTNWHHQGFQRVTITLRQPSGSPDVTTNICCYSMICMLGCCLRHRYPE